MKLFLILYAVIHTWAGSENKTTQNFDATEEIMKLYGRVSVMEHIITEERSANEKLRSRVEALNKDMDTERKENEKLKNKLEGHTKEIEAAHKENEKLKNKLEGHTKEIEAAQKANEKQETEIRGLKEELAVERKVLTNHSININANVKVLKEQRKVFTNHTLKTEADIRELEKKQGEQEVVLTNHSITTKTEMKGLEIKQREQEGVIKEQSVKVYTKIQGLQEQLILLNKTCSTQEKGWTNESIEDIRAEIKELLNETSSGLCDPDLAVYFPRDTKTHQMKQCYTFGGFTPYYLHFVGYGSWGTREREEYHGDVTFDTCVSICAKKRSKDVNWNGMRYWWSGKYCRCLLNMRGLDPSFKDRTVLYSFTS